MRQYRQLSVKQLEGIDSIEGIMRANEIGMADVKAYYKEHAPKPIRLQLTTAQRLGLKKILKLIKTHGVTSDELADIYDFVDGQDAAKEAGQISQVSGTEMVEAQCEPAQLVEDALMEPVKEQAKAEALSVEAEQASTTPALGLEPPRIEQVAQEQAVPDEAQPSMDDPALAEKAMMDMLAEWKAGRKAGQISWNIPSVVSQDGEAERQGGVAQAAQRMAATQFGRRPGDPGYIKYRHPYTLRTWDGKGEMPQWLKESLLDDGMAKKHFIPVENFPLEEETAGLPPGVPFEELAIKFNLKQKPLVN